MGAFILSSGTKGNKNIASEGFFRNQGFSSPENKTVQSLFPGKRYSLPNSRIMIHQPLGGAQGGQTDIDIQVCLVISYNRFLHFFFFFF